MTHLPFFNIEWDRGGMIAAIGWTGPWKADFNRDDDRSLAVRGWHERDTLSPVSGRADSDASNTGNVLGWRPNSRAQPVATAVIRPLLSSL